MAYAGFLSVVLMQQNLSFNLLFDSAKYFYSFFMKKRQTTIMAIIFETKGEFPQNFETTSDLEVLYFKVGLQSFNSEF